MAERISADCRLMPGTASHYIEHLQSLLQIYPKPVVLYARESYDNGKLADQVCDAYVRLARLGIVPIATFDCHERGRITDRRPGLRAALAYAAKHDAIPMAVSRDRWLRAAAWRPSLSAYDCPTLAEYLMFNMLVGLLIPATILPPDDETAHAQRIERGQNLSGHCGGRPMRKSERRRRLEPRAAQMAKDMSLRRVARELNVPVSTINDWVSGFDRNRSDN